MDISVSAPPDGEVRITEFVDGYGSAATRSAYRSELSLWAAHCQRHGRELFEVRRADIETYARHLEAAGLAPATANRRLATITGLYRWALDEGLVTDDRPETFAAPDAPPNRPVPACPVPS
jgi:site-specific recombinase XerD